jgi:hypothetical protein
MHFLLISANSKIYIKSYIKIAPTCFGLRPSSGSLHLSLPDLSYTYVKTMLHAATPPHNTQQRNFTDCFNISVNLARLKFKLPGDGHRSKHVAAILM